MAAPASPECQCFKFRYNREEDTNKETRNILLVVVTLIATVTFQAGVTPPGGVWQDTKDGHMAGRAIYADEMIPFYVFLMSNTAALSTAIHIIIGLTYKFPFHLELWAATAAMLLTYGSALFAILPGESYKKRYFLFAALLPTVAQALKKLYQLTK